MIKPGTLCYVVGSGALSRRLVTALWVVGRCPLCGSPIHRIDEPPLVVDGIFSFDTICERDLRPINDPGLQLEPDPVDQPKRVSA